MNSINRVLIVTVLFISTFTRYDLYAIGKDLTLQDTSLPKIENSNLLNRYNAGNRDTSVLHGMILELENVKDTVNLKSIVNEYILKLSLPLDKEEERILSTYTNKSSDPGFQLLLKAANANYKLPPSSLDSRLIYIIYHENLEQEVKDSSQTPAWDSLGKLLVTKYGRIGDEVYWKIKSIYVYQHKAWIDFVNTFNIYINKYSSRISNFEINNFAYDAYENIDNKILLKKVLNWSQMTIHENNPYYFDTYALLLYALGQKKKAILYEEKAISFATGDLKGEYSRTLDKMKEGELLKGK